MRTKGTAAELEVRRRIAADLLEDGKSVAEIAQMLRLHVSSVKRWRKALQEQGREGIAARPHPGPRAKLTEREQHELCDLLVAGARAAG